MKTRWQEYGIVLAVAAVLAGMVLANSERSKVNESRIMNVEARSKETSEILRDIQDDVKELLQRKEPRR